MNSLNTTTKNDLQSQLIQLGLTTTAQTVDDFIARATKGRWSPQMMLEELTRSEIQERSHRSFQRRLQRSRVGRFKPMADFEWNWPKKIDRSTIERALTLDFIPEARNHGPVIQRGILRS